MTEWTKSDLDSGKPYSVWGHRDWNCVVDKSGFNVMRHKYETWLFTDKQTAEKLASEWNQ